MSDTRPISRYGTVKHVKSDARWLQRAQQSRYYVPRRNVVHVIRQIGDGPPVGPPFSSWCGLRFTVFAGTLQTTAPPDLPLCETCAKAADVAAEWPR